MKERENRPAGLRRVLVVTLVLNLLVAAAKILNGIQTGTLSVRADGFHSGVDGANNVLGLLGLWWSLRPPDEKHPYGHQKVEVLAASAVGASLVLMSGDLVREALDRWRGQPTAPEPTALTLVVLGVTLGVNLFVAQYETRRARQLGSTFLESDASHTRSDVFVTLGVLVTVVAVRAGHAWLDAVFACLVALFILVTGIRVISRNVDYLMDSAQLDAGLVEAVVRRVPGVAGAHKIRTRGSPGAICVDLHIQVARHLDVAEAHRVTHWVIDALKKEAEGVQDVVVHTEPAADGARYPELPDDILRYWPDSPRQ